MDSAEERGGTSLSNSEEAHLTLHLFCVLEKETQGLSTKSRVALITPYSQQVGLLKRMFENRFGSGYAKIVDISTVDAFQGKEANIVIFSCVRGFSKGVGIGFLSDVQRMNVALTRAKHFLFVIARCRTIIVNPYWRDLVSHARQHRAIIKVPIQRIKNKNSLTARRNDAMDHRTIEEQMFPNLTKIAPLHPEDSMASRRGDSVYESDGNISA